MTNSSLGADALEGVRLHRPTCKGNVLYQHSDIIGVFPVNRPDGDHLSNYHVHFVVERKPLIRASEQMQVDQKP